MKNCPVRNLLGFPSELSNTDVLALLYRSPDTFWTPQAISQRLGIDEDSVKRSIDALLSAGLIVAATRTVAYRFAPRQSGDLRAFADAFKLKKE
jgi:predicted transcriptional regulator